MKLLAGLGGEYLNLCITKSSTSFHTDTERKVKLWKSRSNSNVWHCCLVQASDKTCQSCQLYELNSAAVPEMAAGVPHQVTTMLAVRKASVTSCELTSTPMFTCRTHHSALWQTADAFYRAPPGSESWSRRRHLPESPVPWWPATIDDDGYATLQRC